MHSGPSGLSDPRSPLKNEPQPPQPLTPCFPTNLTSGIPAKRITFYKSGDLQFSGVRMAIHNRSFKCFDALLDDLSQKVPLPFGVRTITTPRGTHSIKRLEQLEDGGCYLCSDRRHTKPINMELAGKRTAMWHHHSRPPNARRKPRRPEEAPPPEHANPHYYRHPKRIVLVKNADPAVRRSIVLSRRTARSLRVFIEEVSELLQCHVRKLYTIEGRKIDSIQSLIHCPSVLVCVGREPFKPLMLECRKSSEEKLPGVSVHSRSSLCSEGHESKKNVNFGLETKKSIIHPRSDSSNRSTRFSLSSEKSYPNGVCTPGQVGYVANCPHVKETVLNDDIEKRVLVNKDGSLSVEMKVRFRLTNDETLQWSTEIKKAPGAVSEASKDKQGHVHYLQQARETSEQESSGDVEEAYTSKSHQQRIEDTHCENCCNHCQEYDIWENPVHKEHHTTSRHVKSSSSSASSHKIVCKKASVDSIRTISRSSEEYTEHVVEKASCYQQTVGGGDTMVEYCTISRCCSRSEVCSMAATSKTKRSHAERCSRASKVLTNGEQKPNTADKRHHHPGVCCVEVTKASDAEDRPVSEISNSSKVLESLKEDQDDDDDESITPSSSRVSSHAHGDLPNEVPSRTKTSSTLPDERLLSPKRREGSEMSAKHRTKSTSPSPVLQQHASHTPNGPPDKTASRSSSKCHSCHCGSDTPNSASSNTPVNADEDDRPQSTVSKHSQASKGSCHSHKGRSNSPQSEAKSAQDRGEVEQERGHEADQVEEDRLISSMSKGSKGSGKCSVCPHCGHEAESGSAQSEEPAGETEDNQPDQEDEAKPPSVTSTGSALSAKSEKSGKSIKSRSHTSSRSATPVSAMADGEKETQPDKRVESAQSNHSNASAGSKKSTCSVCSNCRRSAANDSAPEEETPGSATNDKVAVEEERVGSSLSNKSKLSEKSNHSNARMAKTPMSKHSGSPASISEDAEGKDEATPDQSDSASQTSGTSRKSKVGEVMQKVSETSATLDKQGDGETPTQRSDTISSLSHQASDEEKQSPVEAENTTEVERTTSVMSNRTNASRKSHCSNCSAPKSVKSVEPNMPNPTSSPEDGEGLQKRADSAMSAKSKNSIASETSAKPQSQEKAETENPANDTEERAESVLSNKSATKVADESEGEIRAPSAMSHASGRSKASHKSAHSTSSRAKSPRAKSPLKVSECNGPIDGNADNSEAEDEQRAPSVKSGKTDASSKSKTSLRTVIAAPQRAKSPRPKSPARVSQENENKAEKRPESSLSAKSNVTRTSRQSKRAVSPAHACQEHGNSPHEERPSSAMSLKSVKSSPRSDEETAPEDKETRETTAEDTKQNTSDSPANLSQAEVEEIMEECTASAMSNKTNCSVKSKASHKSDKAQAACAKSPASCEKVRVGESEIRPLSSLSLNADAARSPKKTRGEEDKRSPSPAVKQHVRDKTESPLEQRPKSAMSSKSTKSQKTSHSPGANGTGKTKDMDQRPQSSLSQTLDKKLQEDAIDSTPSHEQHHNAPAGQEVTLALDEVNERPKSALSVASRTSKKSNREPSPRPKSSQSKSTKVEEGPRAASGMSVESHISSNSKKCQCKHSKNAPSKTPDSAESSRSKLPQTPPDSPDTKEVANPPTPDNAGTREDDEDQVKSNVISSPTSAEREGRSEQRNAESVKSVGSSAKTKAGSQKKNQRDRSPSALSTSSAKATRSKSPVPAKAEQPSACTQPGNQSSKNVGENSGSENAAHMNIKDPRPKSRTSVRSVKSTKSHNAPKTDDVAKQTSNLDVRASTTDVDGKSENGSVKSSKSNKKAKSVKFDKKTEKEMTAEKSPQPKSAATSDASPNCASPASDESNRGKPPAIVLASTSSDSVLSNALSAADLLRELSGNSRPATKSSKNITSDGKESDNVETESKSSKRKKVNTRQGEKQASLELVHSCLPNASPNDVVNEWLQKIPVDGPLYQMEDELNGSTDQSLDNASVVKQECKKEADETAREEDSDGQCKGEDRAPEETKECEDYAEENAETDEPDKPVIQEDTAEAAHAPPKPSLESLEKEHFPRRSHSSVQVMKALLGPKMDRCNSLPEVSPVYGRKLSKSAEGLLDCLTKLRLIDTDPSNSFDSKYNEIMHILQTLWLYEPSESIPKAEMDTENHATAEDEANPRSSSGVEVSSGSNESAKSNSAAGKTTPAPPTVVVQQQTESEVQESEEISDDKAEEESPAEPAYEEGGDGESDPEQTVEPDNGGEVSDPATPDVAARTRGGPDSEEKTDDADAENEVPEKELMTDEITAETVETSQPLSDTVEKDSKTTDKNEGDSARDASSGTQPSAQRVQLSRKVSQDPDPTWVLSLLKKIEKQFMTHYANAMAEFKVRWNLDDNVMLDTMINELKVEVHKRIQESIKRELQKIQGRAGKMPRPPGSELSKESSIQTDQRRRRLKVMRVRSFKPSNSDESDAASGTDFSDQRSEDEYCPCDACIRKKLEARQMLRAELMNTAPVRMEFDLLKILQVKKDPSPAPKPQVPPTVVEQPESQSEAEPQETVEEGSNLEPVLEEPEQGDKEEENETDNKEESDNQEEEEEGQEDAEKEEKGETEGEPADEEDKDEDLKTGETEIAEEGEEEDGEADDDKEVEQAEGESQEAGNDEAARDDTAEGEGKDQQISKDETEDDAIAEQTPMDDTEGDVNPVDSADAVDEIEEEEGHEDQVEEEIEDDAIAESEKAGEVAEEPKDQEQCDNEGEEEDIVADLKEANKDLHEHFTSRQMTRSSVECQPGSMDSFELEAEATQIVKSVFATLQGQKTDRDETDDGLKTTSKKRSRSPARVNKQRRPKDNEVKVDDLEF